MPVTKLKSKWSSGNLVFYGDGNLHFGEDDDGIDVKFFGATSGAYMLWDESADQVVFDKADILLGDSDYLKLGDSSDITMTWNGTKMLIGQAGTNSAIEVGVDGAGLDLKLFGDTSGKYLLWDQSADKLVVVGDYDITGASQFTGVVTVGVDDTGHDVKFYGATSGKYMLWDESADKLIVVGTADLGSSCEADAYTVGGTAGVDYSGAGATITEIIKGIVTAAS